MHITSFKRCLTLLIALVMVLSLAPISVLATETEESGEHQASTEASEPAPTETEEVPTESTEFSTEPAEPSTESIEPSTEPENVSAVEKLQNRIDAVLNLYGITSAMTDEEIAAAIIAADGNTIQQTMTERDAIDADATVLTQEQLLTLELKLYERFWSVFDPMFTAVPAVAVTGVSGVEVTADSNGSVSESNGIVTATVSGNFLSQKKTTITVTNTSGSTAKISFNFSASQYNSFTLSNSSSGEHSVTLKNGETLTFDLQSKSFTLNTTATVTLSNFKVETAAANVNVTVNYNSSLGSVSVASTAVASGSVHSVSSTTGATFAATAVSGASFLGWINTETGKLLSTASSYTVIPSEEMTIQAAFGSATSPAFFGVGTLIESGNFFSGYTYSVPTFEYAFDTLTDANDYASSSSSAKYIVPLSNGVLPAGDYTISEGVTLLIPFDTAGTLCTTKPQTTDESFVAPSVYRTLTMASGANITVNGAISISGTQSAQYSYNGRPYGSLGFINMNSGSSITVNSGANLYVWGYITGSGSVTVKGSGTVYECFQVMDYRGGDATSSLQNNEYNVFPMSQYYIQNVEVPMTMEAGAVEYGFMSVTVTLAGIQDALVPFIGSEGMFNITSGSLVKDFDEGEDRLEVNISGDVSVNPYTFSIKVGTIGTVTLDTSKYILPINQNITINLNSGTLTVSQDIALLPETEINIAEGAYCTLTGNAKLIVYDLDDWGGYCGEYNREFIAVPYAPGRASSAKRTNLTKDASILINGTADASNGYVYTTSGGANIYSTGTGKAIVRAGSEERVYQVTQSSSSITGYPEISINPAKLKNAVTTPAYTETSGASTATTYEYINGIWCSHAEPDEAVREKVVEATCVAAGSYDSVVYCSVCEKELSREKKTISATGEHTITDHRCSGCGLFEITAASMTMANSLDMNFAFRQDHVEDWTGYYAVITKTNANNEITEQRLDVNTNQTATVENAAHYYVTFNGIAGKEMTDPISVTIYDADGNPASFVWNDSVQAQAMRNLALSSATDASKKMVVDMLNYGAAAQTNFSYRTEDPANGKLSDDQKKLATGDITFTNTATIPSGYKANVYLVSNIQFMMAFKDIDPSMRAVVSFTDHYGTTPWNIEISGSEFTDRGNGYYSLTIDKTVVADGRQMITCIIYNSDGSEVTRAVDSMECYAARATQSTSKDLYTMIMKFSDSAKAYLATK